MFRLSQLSKVVYSRFSSYSQTSPQQLHAQDHSLLKQIYTYSCYEHYMGYIILDHHSKSIIAIDPGEPESIINNVQMLRHQLQYNFTHVLQTHGKSKHTRCSSALSQQFDGLKVMCGDAGSDITSYYTHLARDLTPFEVGELSICFMAAPGHTKDNFMIAVSHAPNSTNSKLPILFTGDTLLLSSIGEIEDLNAYYNTLQRLRGFPGETLIFPGHRLQKEHILFTKTLDPSNALVNLKLQQIYETEEKSTRPHFIPTTLQEERIANLYLRLSDRTIQNVLSEQDPIQCMRKLRLIEQNFFSK